MRMIRGDKEDGGLSQTSVHTFRLNVKHGTPAFTYMSHLCLGAALKPFSSGTLSHILDYVYSGSSFFLGLGGGGEVSSPEVVVYSYHVLSECM